MAENWIVEKVIERFKDESSRSERELTVKEKNHQNTVYKVSELLLVSIWKNLLKPVLRWFFPRKLQKLKKEIANLKRRIECCAQAETDLRKGKYELAILLLDEMINSSPATIPPTPTVPNFEGIVQTQIRDERFYYLLDLRQQLISLQKAKAATAIQ